MSKQQIEKIKQDARDYAWAIFNQGETDRIISFENFVNVIFDYIDVKIESHCEEKHE